MLVKHNNNSISELTTAGQLASGSLVPISEQTASGSASIEFTTGIDSTYPIYKFEFINCQPVTDNKTFEFQGSTDGGSNYNTTMTTTYFRAFHYENDSSNAFGYVSTLDQAQGTNYQNLANNMGSDSDENLGGELILYNPSSTTFVKHFMSRTSGLNPDETGIAIDTYVAGYFNTTSAINAMSFKYVSSNINGKIKLYGIKDS